MRELERHVKGTIQNGAVNNEVDLLMPLKRYKKISE